MNFSTLEKFLLIAHHPDKGRFIISGLQMDYGIIGAILMDMSLDDKIALENDRVIIKKGTGTGNQILSEVISMISSAGKSHSIKHWITKLARRSGKYKWIALAEMAEKKVIQIENRMFLGIVTHKKSYLLDSYNRNKMIQQLKYNVLSHKELSNETTAILGMIEACKMHRIISTETDELKKIKKELKLIIKESPVASMVDQTIRQVEAAVFGALAASTAAATAAHH
jgi:Golgi phosphoprotein 3